MGRDTNPFAPFTNLLDEMGATEAAEAVTMFPLSPFAIARPGESGGTSSPEEGTKRAIRQLYGVLLGLDSDSPVDTWKQLFDTALFDAPSFTVEQFTGVTTTTYRIWFHSLSQLLVESFTLQIVHTELVVDDHKRTTETGRWLWRLPQGDREHLLKRCTDLDDEVVEEMQTTRQYRDELLYDFGSWSDIEPGDAISKARQHLAVLRALESYVTDDTAFQYVPDGMEQLEDDED
jgi:hypothetical protein